MYSSLHLKTTENLYLFLLQHENDIIIIFVPASIQNLKNNLYSSLNLENATNLYNNLNLKITKTVFLPKLKNCGKSVFLPPPKNCGKSVFLPQHMYKRHHYLRSCLDHKTIEKSVFFPQSKNDSNSAILPKPKNFFLTHHTNFRSTVPFTYYNVTFLQA